MECNTNGRECQYQFGHVIRALSRKSGGGKTQALALRTKEITMQYLEERIIHVIMTSEDLFEMARKAREIETTDKLGSDLTIKEWSLGKSGGVHVTLKIYVDQERAQYKGLMK